MQIPRRLATAACMLLIAATTRASAAEEVRQSVPPLLASHDANRDGRLTLDELNVAREQQLARFDIDADGRLAVEEYAAFWVDTLRERMVRQFRADDQDHDGEVTIDELKQRAAELVRRRDLDQDGALTAEELRPRRRTREASAAPMAGEKSGPSPTAVE